MRGGRTPRRPYARMNVFKTKLSSLPQVRPESTKLHCQVRQIATACPPLFTPAGCSKWSPTCQHSRTRSMCFDWKCHSSATSTPPMHIHASQRAIAPTPLRPESHAHQQCSSEHQRGIKISTHSSQLATGHYGTICPSWGPDTNIILSCKTLIESLENHTAHSRIITTPMLAR